MQPQTLKFKLVLYLTIALTVGVLLFTGAVAFFLYNQILGKVSDHVIQLSEVISKSTRFAMLKNEPTYVDRIIHDVAGQEQIDRVKNLQPGWAHHPFDLPARDRPYRGSQRRGLLALP